MKRLPIAIIVLLLCANVAFAQYIVPKRSVNVDNPTSIYAPIIESQSNEADSIQTYIEATTTAVGAASDSIEAAIDEVTAAVNAVNTSLNDSTQTNIITGVDYVSGQSGVDGSTEAQIIIDYSHHETHDGNHYKGGFSDTSMATGDTVAIVFTTPDTTVWAHWSLTAQCTGALVVQVFENPTLAAVGTGVTEWNRDRNSENVALVAITHTPTITSAGTKMVEKWIGGTGFKEDISGSHTGDQEFILKQNEEYLVLGIAVGDGIKGAVGGDWYEHRNKN